MMEYIIKFHLSNHSSKALEKPQIDCDETTLLILIQNTKRFSLKEEGLSNDFVSLNPQITMRYRDGTKTTPMHYLSVSKDRPTLALANKSDQHLRLQFFFNTVCLVHLIVGFSNSRLKCKFPTEKFTIVQVHYREALRCCCKVFVFVSLSCLTVKRKRSIIPIRSYAKHANDLVSFCIDKERAKRALIDSGRTDGHLPSFKKFCAYMPCFRTPPCTQQATQMSRLRNVVFGMNGNVSSSPSFV